MILLKDIEEGSYLVQFYPWTGVSTTYKVTGPPVFSPAAVLWNDAFHDTFGLDVIELVPVYKKGKFKEAKQVGLQQLRNFAANDWDTHSDLNKRILHEDITLYSPTLERLQGKPYFGSVPELLIQQHADRSKRTKSNAAP